MNNKKNETITAQKQTGISNQTKHGIWIPSHAIEAPLTLTFSDLSGITDELLIEQQLKHIEQKNKQECKKRINWNENQVRIIEVECILYNYQHERERYSITTERYRPQTDKIQKFVQANSFEFGCKKVQFATKICDLGREAAIMVNLYLYMEGYKIHIGGSTVPIFNTERKLKHSTQVMKIHIGKKAHPKETPGGIDVSQLRADIRWIHSEILTVKTKQRKPAVLEKGLLSTIKKDMLSSFKNYKLSNGEIYSVMDPYVESQLLEYVDIDKWFKKQLMGEVMITFEMPVYTDEHIQYKEKSPEQTSPNTPTSPSSPQNKITTKRKERAKQLKRQQEKEREERERKKQEKKRKKQQEEGKYELLHIYYESKKDKAFVKNIYQHKMKTKQKIPKHQRKNREGLYNRKCYGMPNPEINRTTPTEKMHIQIMLEKFEGDLEPENETMDELEEYMKMPILYALQDENIDPSVYLKFWKHRIFLQQKKPQSLVWVLANVVITEKNEVEHEIDPLLDTTRQNSWKSAHPSNFLILLSETFSGRTKIREFAAKHLFEKHLNFAKRYLVQLITCIRHGDDMEKDPIFQFIMKNVTKDLEFAIVAYWTLFLEKENATPQKEQYGKLLDKLHGELSDKKPAFSLVLRQQKKFRKLLSELRLINIKFDGAKAAVKVEEKIKSFNEEIKGDAFAHPLFPEYDIVSVNEKNWKTFTSEARPLLIYLMCCHRETNTIKKMPIIYKTGDDLRQDNAVIQVIRYLQDQSEYDLNMTPYGIFAFSTDDGLVEAVMPSEPFESVGNVIDFLKDKIFQELGIPMQSPLMKVHLEKRLARYEMSVAAYAAVSYILGFGDRHLHNILLGWDGKLFHIDFGWILGRNPRFYCAEIKLVYNMVHCLNFEELINRIVMIYLYISKHFDVIVLFFHMLGKSGIKGIDLYAFVKFNQSVSSSSKSLFFAERMKPMNTVEAQTKQIIHVLAVSRSSVTKIVEGFHDSTHTFAQILRK